MPIWMSSFGFKSWTLFMIVAWEFFSPIYSSIMSLWASRWIIVMSDKSPSGSLFAIALIDPMLMLCSPPINIGLMFASISSPAASSTNPQVLSQFPWTMFKSPQSKNSPSSDLPNLELKFSKPNEASLITVGPYLEPLWYEHVLSKGTPIIPHFLDFKKSIGELDSSFWIWALKSSRSISSLANANFPGWKVLKSIESLVNFLKNNLIYKDLYKNKKSFWESKINKLVILKNHWKIR